VIGLLRLQDSQNSNVQTVRQHQQRLPYVAYVQQQVPRCFSAQQVSQHANMAQATANASQVINCSHGIPSPAPESKREK